MLKAARIFPSLGLLLFAAVVAAQTGTGRPAQAKSKELPDCPERNVAGQCGIRIDKADPQAPGSVRVPNNTRVRIVVDNKTPFEKCALEKKREEFAAEADAIAKILSIIVQAAPVFKLVRPTGDIPESLKELKGLAEKKPTPLTRQIMARLEALSQAIPKQNEEVDKEKGKYEKLAKDLPPFIERPNPDSFTRDYARHTNDIAARLRDALPTTESLDIELAFLKEDLKQLHEKRETDPEIIAKIDKIADETFGDANLLKKSIEALAEMRSELEKIHRYLKSIKIEPPPEFKQEFPLVADQNAKISGTVTCTNQVTKQVTMDEVPFAVIYYGLPRATVSAGVLVAMLDQRQIGSEPIRTGTLPDGVPTFKVVFADVNRAGTQLVPFSFFNVRLHDWIWGKRQFTLNAVLGVGVNPNSGTNEAEFFQGLGIGIQNVHFHLGNHTGRFQELGGGFGMGDTVPPGLAGVPIRRRYTHHWGIGISYRLPLP